MKRIKDSRHRLRMGLLLGVSWALFGCELLNEGAPVQVILPELPGYWTAAFGESGLRAGLARRNGAEPIDAAVGGIPNAVDPRCTARPDTGGGNGYHQGRHPAVECRRRLSVARRRLTKRCGLSGGTARRRRCYCASIRQCTGCRSLTRHGFWKRSGIALMATRGSWTKAASSPAHRSDACASSTSSHCRASKRKLHCPPAAGARSIFSRFEQTVSPEGGALLRFNRLAVGLHRFVSADRMALVSVDGQGEPTAALHPLP